MVDIGAGGEKEDVSSPPNDVDRETENGLVQLVAPTWTPGSFSLVLRV